MYTIRWAWLGPKEAGVERLLRDITDRGPCCCRGQPLRAGSTIDFMAVTVELPPATLRRLGRARDQEETRAPIHPGPGPACVTLRFAESRAATTRSTQGRAFLAYHASKPDKCGTKRRDNSNGSHRHASPVHARGTEQYRRPRTFAAALVTLTLGGDMRSQMRGITRIISSCSSVIRRCATALAALALCTALGAGCSSKDSATTTAPVTGPSFNFTFPTAGQSVEFTFPTAGSFGYRCAAHPSMTGTVDKVAEGVLHPELFTVTV